MYNVVLTKQAVKQSKKRGQKFKKEVRKILQNLSLNPYPLIAQRLSGKLNFLYSYHFSFSGGAFRLAYSIDGKNKEITVIALGPRENFYEVLKQKLS